MEAIRAVLNCCQSHVVAMGYAPPVCVYVFVIVFEDVQHGIAIPVSGNEYRFICVRKQTPI